MTEQAPHMNCDLEERFKRLSNRSAEDSFFDTVGGAMIRYKEEVSKEYGFNDDYFVIGDAFPVASNTITSRKNRNCELAGVPQIRIHDFRHSCASLLVNNGANITVVAKYLGHTKIEETLNTYTHLFNSALNEVVDLIDKLE